MRILITNDDGVFAPGIAALARGLWAALGDRHDLVVVAPMVDHSGAGAAVGRVYERESIPYEEVDLPGLAHVPTFGIDGPPALAVIVACIEGFGPRPDLVVSGINHGVNAGRSALHSGTVGATLTGAQFGIRGLAVSIAWGEDPVPWETPVGLAAAILPTLVGAPPSTVLNLNVPAVTPDRLRGIRHGTLGRVGLIRAVRPEATPEPVAGAPPDFTAPAHNQTQRGMGVGADRIAEQAELEPESDAALLAAGWATLTPLSGVREDVSEGAAAALEAGLAAAVDAATTPGQAPPGRVD
jgi:5'-nucleotidase